MSHITMIDPQRFSRTHSDLFWHSDLFGLFKAELARADAMTGLVDPGRALWRRFATFYRGLARLPRKARRALQRRWRRSLGGIALLCALGQVPAALADQIDVGVNGCTLVDAITAANTNEPMGGCTAGSGADTITLPAGSTQSLAPVEPYYGSSGPTGLPPITSAIVIDGNGSTIARDDTDPQAPEFRILAVDPGGDLVLQETTVTGGVISSFDGGGIFNGGTLTLTNSVVSGNSASSGGGVNNYGTLALTNSTVSGNSAAIGGGLRNSGTLTLTDSTVSGNSAGYGGGVRNYGALTLSRSTVSDNSAAAGGGMFNSSSGTLTLTDSTVSGNSAGYGGGVRNSGALTVSRSTVSGNSAAAKGGGIFNSVSGTLTLTNSTVSGNTASSEGPEGYHPGLGRRDRLVSGNTASSEGPEVYNYMGYVGDGYGTVNANDFNLFGYDGSSGVTGFTPGVTDIVPSVSLSAILDPALADNGGPTRTHALVTGSPAIDAIPAASCATIGDQRGVTRPQDGDEDTNADCDIGAFELQLPPFPTITTPTKLLPSQATAEQNPKVQCLGSDCRVRIKCDAVQGSIEPCDARIDVFVRASDLRLDEGGATRARRRIRFAVAVANIPPGETANVPLRLTKRGRRIVRTGMNRRLRGVMEIRNPIGPVQTVRVRLRLRLRR